MGYGWEGAAVQGESGGTVFECAGGGVLEAEELRSEEGEAVVGAVFGDDVGRVGFGARGDGR